MELPPLSHFNARLAAAVRSKRRPDPEPELPHVVRVAGETHEVLVRVAIPIGDVTLITCERLDDPQVLAKFSTPGRVEEGTVGTIRWVAGYRAGGWKFVPEVPTC